MKDILVHLNEAENLATRLQTVSALASRFGSHITGLYTKHPLMYEVYGTFVHPDIVNETLKAEEDAATEAKQIFATQLCGDASLEDAENISYIETTGEAAHQLVRHSCVHDLVVVPKGKVGEHNENLNAIAANVVLESGRPVLILPSESPQPTIGKSIFVAWNGTAESARAVHDAMPLLQAAEAVNVVTFQDHDKHSASVMDITAHLEHHKVIFDVSDSQSKESEIMDNMFRLTDRFESDLVVMGAYGHSRFREYVLGGVSRSAISELKIPLFVSH